MSTLRGIVVGSLGLAALDALVSTDTAASRAGGLITGTADLARAFLSPEVPAIRDRSGCLDNGNPRAKGSKGAKSTASRVGRDAGTLAQLTNPGTAIQGLGSLITGGL